MDHGKAHLGKHRLHFVSHPKHIIRFLQSTGIVVAGGVYVHAIRGIGFGGVGMDNEDLRPRFGGGQGKGQVLIQCGCQVHLQLGPVI